jgi:SWIM zinc finger
MQGSGSKPYQTQIDTATVSCKCSCPSRKFPCKHGIGLLLLYSQKAADFKDVPEPTWVSDWLNKRAEKAVAKAAEPAESTTENDEGSEKKAKDKAKRDNERLMKVQAGAAELELWLKDLVRTGLISLPEKGHAFFQKTTARMVDAQAKGLANRVRKLGELNFYNGTAWHEAALMQVCELFTLLEAFKNIENLPKKQQADIRTQIGWEQRATALAADDTAEMVMDEWLVLARITTQEEDMVVQRNWLYGCTTQRYGFILNFAHKSQPIETLFVAGRLAKANLLYFPSNMPFRAIVKAQTENTTVLKHVLTPLANWKTANDDLVKSRKKLFWAEDLPQFVGGLTIAKHQENWFLKDNTGAFQAIDSSFSTDKIWQILSVSGGTPLNLFVLRIKNTVFPLGYIENGQYFVL